MVEIDGLVGDVLDTLQAQGLRDHTIVIFTSDNGSHEAASTEGESYSWGTLRRDYGHHANAPWRGRKGDIWEGGHRVPFLMSWPGHIPAGQINPHLVGSIDLYATLADLLEINIPEGQAEDSESFLASLMDPANPTRHDMVVQNSQGVMALRAGPWKYIPQNGGELYHLEQDPQESHNVMAEHPDIASDMQRRLQEIIQH